ncbi:hypothetical protein SODALDRAFT_331653 [Sodiomyces alkalinus F11]|uniref:DUF7721 domain-containing protein n=1 Tax=Sodiomyces alkalinus (strain CBS 110278 / VKM F-3762 / F11) TaxID=1314773 RepID=A0A3N2PYN6_SODAK|nr:hypothetical protein SODALDRAFT_331653 [Sodiomyces alkalinus F11]ROT39536.1 hypothetical protein SODALDRAFT_331653 [Sodiomyces alkalinus F11]
MDKLFSTAKDFLQEQTDKDDNKQQQQQQQPPQPQALPGGNKGTGGSYPIPGGDDDDFRSAATEAARQAGSHGDRDLFSNVLGTLGQKKAQVEKEDVDENDILTMYKKFAGGEAGAKEQADEKSLGAAAAMQALKRFNSGEVKGQKDTQGGFLALAMAEGSKLFDDSAKDGRVKQGTTKEGVIQQAGEMALKLFFKSQVKQGGAGGLVDMASKFLK